MPKPKQNWPGLIPGSTESRSTPASRDRLAWRFYVTARRCPPTRCPWQWLPGLRVTIEPIETLVQLVEGLRPAVSSSRLKSGMASPILVKIVMSSQPSRTISSTLASIFAAMAAISPINGRSGFRSPGGLSVRPAMPLGEPVEDRVELIRP